MGWPYHLHALPFSPTLIKSWPMSKSAGQSQATNKGTSPSLCHGPNSMRTIVSPKNSIGVPSLVVAAGGLAKSRTLREGRKLKAEGGESMVSTIEVPWI
jgi:hypothetical protein